MNRQRCESGSATAVGLLKELLSDFPPLKTASESPARYSGGNLMERTPEARFFSSQLDAEDVLKQDDQGVSFTSLCASFSRPPNRKSSRRSSPNSGRIDELSQQSDGLATVRRMVPPSLIADAEKVMPDQSTSLCHAAATAGCPDRVGSASSNPTTRGHPGSRCRPCRCAPAAISAPRWMLASMWHSCSRGRSGAPPAEFAKMDLSEGQVDDAACRVVRDARPTHRLDWAAMRQRIHALHPAPAGP